MVQCLISHSCDTETVDKYGYTALFAAVVMRHYGVLRVLEGDSAFEKRFVRTERSWSDVDCAAAAHLECDGLVYNDLGCLIRCDDTVVLPDGSALDCKTAIVRVLELNEYELEPGDNFKPAHSLSWCHALMSLSCLLRDGETVTLRSGRVLDNRSCLVEAADVVGSRSRNNIFYGELLVRLGILLRDPSETVALAAVASHWPPLKIPSADGKISGRECLIRAVEYSGEYCPLLYLGVRLGDNESIRIQDDELLTKKLCFERGAMRCSASDWSMTSDLSTVNRIRRAAELVAQLYFQLGLVLFREENGILAANDVDKHLSDEHDAASCFLRSLNGCCSSVANFYFGLALPTSKSVELRARVSRDSIARAVEIEDDLMR